MSRIISIVIFFTSFVINSQTLIERDRLEILQVLEKQSVSWNESNIEAYMDGYWKSDSLRFIGKNGITYGWKATLERYRKAYPDKEAMGFLKFEVLSLEFLSPNKTFIIGKWNLERKGDKNIGGHFTLIWEKIKGKWLITVDHTS